MTDQLFEPMELTGSELDVVAGGSACNPCNRCNPCDPCKDSVSVSVDVDVSICLSL